MEPTVAYLAQGRLFICPPGKTPHEVQSPFARDAEQRQARSRAIDGWKGRSGVWGQMGMAPPEWSQWQQEGIEGRRRINFRSACRGEQPGQMLYVLDLETVSGIFRYELSDQSERRLMHRNDFQASDLVCHPQRGTLAVSLAEPDGSSSLSFSDDEGRHWSHVTGGDSVDQAPSWIPGEGRKLVFQSAGVGRNQAGIRTSLAPYTIETLDLDGDGSVQTVLANEKFDCLLPRMTADGTLYYLRRPYKPFLANELHFGQFLLDVLLLPFRLLYAVFQFLNFLSMMFAGQPLATTLGRRPQAQPQQQFLMLWGHMIDTKRALEKAPRDRPGDLVPKDWQLMRRDSAGAEQVVAEGVLSYDLTPKGEIVLTNGSAVFFVDSDGQKRKLCDQPLIDSVVVLTQPASSEPASLSTTDLSSAASKPASA